MRITKVDWLENEYESAKFFDLRLQRRAIRLLQLFTSHPQSPINQVCPNWAEAKAAYRFFNNHKVTPSTLLAPHIEKCEDRAKTYSRILAIQDTTLLNYSSHTKMKDLGRIGNSMTEKGLMLHTVFAVTTEGLPIGILNQRFFTHEEKKNKPSLNNLAISHKGYNKRNGKPLESEKWIEGLVCSKYNLSDSGCEPITVCDREGDFYELFETAAVLKAHLIVRVRHNRMVIGALGVTEGKYQKRPKRLWKLMKSLRKSGLTCLEVPSRGGANRKPAHSAEIEVKLARIKVLPAAGYTSRARYTKIILHSVHAVELNAPKGEPPLEWMLVTNLPVATIEKAIEITKWYALRFRIEIFHRILKSGFLVEDCRLGSSQAIANYVSLISVAAWKIFWITMIGRIHPSTPCTFFLSDQEWKLLYGKFYPNQQLPENPLTSARALHLIARLGGYFDRGTDTEPGVISIWRGWRRLTDLTEGSNTTQAA